MNKIYEFNYDRSKWRIIETRENECKIQNKETHNSFIIGGRVDGIEQYDENRFVIHISYANEHKIICIRIEEGEIFKDYTGECFDFEFLSKNLILLDKDCWGKVYNIETNEETYPFENYFLKEGDKKLYTKRNVEIIYENKKDEYPQYLFFTYEFSAYPINIGSTIQFLVNPVTFKIVSPIYSGLWNKFCELNEKITLEQIYMEHYKETKKIEDYLSELYGRKSLKIFEDFKKFIS